MPRPRPRPPIEATLRFCAGQASALGESPDHWRWLSIGLVMALQESCVIALSGYETASLEDILKPGDNSIAPLKTLLRRVRSEQYLLPPEKLTVSESTVKQALALQAARNQFSHLVPGETPPDFAKLPYYCRATLQLVEHMLVTAPSFADQDLSDLAAREMRKIRDALPETI